NIFDYYLESFAIFTLLPAQIIDNLDYLSPITQETDEDLDFKISSIF
ncbi:2494_t:CDS:1, partial [Gigaspora margarita]